MKIVVQRVSRARVSVGKVVVGKIGKGLLVLMGVSQDDSEKDADFLANKLSSLRVMADKEGKMNLSVVDVKASVLAVSQFTLYGDTSKGNRPSFVKAAEPKKAEKLYDYFIARLRELKVKVETGEFGAYMMIDSELDGPVTILLKSKIENPNSK